MTASQLKSTLTKFFLLGIFYFCRRSFRNNNSNNNNNNNKNNKNNNNNNNNNNLATFNMAVQFKFYNFLVNLESFVIIVKNQKLDSLALNV